MNLKKTKKWYALALAAAMALSMCACSENNTGSTAASSYSNETAAENNENGRTSEETAGQETESEEAKLPEQVTSTAVGEFTITTADGTFTQNGSVYTITSAGTYTLTGILSDGQIIIDAGDEDEVELDLNGVSLTCSYDSVIHALNAGKVKIKAMEGTGNTVDDTRALQTDENDTTGSAAISAECDLSFVGTGTLTVTASYNNGIHTTDDLKIKNLTLNVASPNNALKGNDSVTVESGTVNLVSTSGDGIKTKNADVSEKGNQRGDIIVLDGTLTIYAGTDGMDAAHDVIISGGTLTVKAGDDGIHADNDLQLDGGYVDIVQSHEGLEGHYITVNGGECHVYATDDGVNATGSGSMASDGQITVNGGKLCVEVAGQDVDGIDANGSYVQTGGFVVVSNPYANGGGMAGAMDVDRNVDISGGVIIALGGSGQMGGMGGQTGGMGQPGGQMPGQGGHGGFGGPGGFGGMGGQMGSTGAPDGAVNFTGTLSAGMHTFTYGSTTESFTLKSAVSGGWIFAAGISADNYTLN